MLEHQHGQTARLPTHSTLARKFEQSRAETLLKRALPQEFIEQVVSACSGTPKALADVSPGSERSDNPGLGNIKQQINAESVRHVRNEPFSGFTGNIDELTQGCRSRSNPGLILANAFGVNGRDG